MVEAVFELLGMWTVGYWQEAIAFLGLVAVVIGLFVGSFAIAGTGCLAMVIGGFLLRRKLAERE